MTDRRETKLEEDASRIAKWLAENRARFEQDGISEDSILGVSGFENVDEIRTAVDHLENRVVVVRWREAMTTPPRFKHKPGRNWAPTREHLLGAQSARGGE